MAAWARFVFRHRTWVLVLSVLGWLGCAGLVVHGGNLRNQDTFNFESGKAGDLLTRELPQQTGIPINLIFRNPGALATSSGFHSSVDAALTRVRGDSRVAHIEEPWGYLPSGQSPQADISNDGHAAIVTIVLTTNDFNVGDAEAQSIFDEVTAPPGFTLTEFGLIAVEASINHYVSSDLVLGSSISLPVALLLLVIIFGTLIAAITCLGVGIVAVTGGLAATFVLTHFIQVSPYATDVVGLIGLGVGIDYSLFITSRFREEIGRGSDTATALARAYSTAGRAICYSGLIVAIGLSGMLFFNGTFLVSMGLAGAAVVIATLITSLTFLASLLALLGPRVNRLRVPVFGRERTSGRGAWHSIATTVMRHPIVVLVPTLAVLFLTASPFPSVRLANSDAGVLPESSPARQGTEELAREFPQQNENTIDVVLQFDSGAPTTAANMATAYSLANTLASFHGVDKVESYVSITPSAPLTFYTSLYANGVSQAPPQAAAIAHATLGSDIAVLEVQTPYAETSDSATALMKTIRAHDHVAGATTYVGGFTAFNSDFVDFMVTHTPLVIGYVMLVTFVILLVLLRSIVLPIKAVVMNLLSLTAAFGAMVWIFQQGHLSGLFSFTPQDLDPTLPALLFCIVFGLSMDYEVFLLTRMQEAWVATGDNRRAVAEGLEICGRLVTGAAAIMIAVFAAFAFGHVVLIKAIGMGMAIAVFTDATLVRALVVPALMRLLGRANWWAPGWLRPRTAGHSSRSAA